MHKLKPLYKTIYACLLLADQEVIEAAYDHKFSIVKRYLMGFIPRISYDSVKNATKKLLALDYLKKREYSQKNGFSQIVLYPNTEKLKRVKQGFEIVGNYSENKMVGGWCSGKIQAGFLYNYRTFTGYVQISGLWKSYRTPVESMGYKGNQKTPCIPPFLNGFRSTYMNKVIYTFLNPIPLYCINTGYTKSKKVEMGTKVGQVFGGVGGGVNLHRLAKSVRDDAVVCGCVDLLEGFSRFWGDYPLRKNVFQAWKSWKKLKPGEELVSVMLSELHRQAVERDLLKLRGMFTPPPKNASTWLNGRCWEDECYLTPDNQLRNDHPYIQKHNARDAQKQSKPTLEKYWSTLDRLENGDGFDGQTYDGEVVTRH